MTPKRVTIGGAHIRRLASGQHSSGKTLQPWRAVGATVSAFTGPGMKPQISRTNSVCFTTELTDRLGPVLSSYSKV